LGRPGAGLDDRVARSPVSFLPASIYINSAFLFCFCNQSAGPYTVPPCVKMTWEAIAYAGKGNKKGSAEIA